MDNHNSCMEEVKKLRSLLDEAIIALEPFANNVDFFESGGFKTGMTIHGDERKAKAVHTRLKEGLK